MFFLSALILGFMGSLHCVGMCGPLVAAMPLTGNRLTSTISKTSIYHGSRIVAYGMLGLLPGVIGEGIQFTGLQQWTSLLVGLFFIGVFVVVLIRQQDIHWAAWQKGSAYIQNLIQPILQSKGPQKLVGLGFFNGLIPCGMTYMAMATALTSTQVMDGVLFMMVFGLGTAPALMAISIMGHYQKGLWRQQLKVLIPLGYLVIGALLIYRGLFIDVPLDLRVLKVMGWESLCH